MIVEDNYDDNVLYVNVAVVDLVLYYSVKMSVFPKGRITAPKNKTTLSVRKLLQFFQNVFYNKKKH